MAKKKTTIDRVLGDMLFSQRRGIFSVAVGNKVFKAKKPSKLIDKIRKGRLL